MKKSKIIVIGFVVLMALSAISFTLLDQNSFTAHAASSNLALDGHNSATATSGTSFTLTLSTSNPNDLLYITVNSYTRYVTGITSSLNSLTWNCRQASGSTLSSNSYYLSTWYVIQPSSGATTITITMSGSLSTSNVATVVVFGITGADTSTSPFDGAYSSTSGSSNHPTYSKVTSNANNFIVGALAVRPGSSSVPAITAGLTSVSSTATYDTGSYRLETTDEYQVVSAAYPSGFSVPYSWSTSNCNWAMVVDAVKAATVPVTFNTSGQSSDASGTILTIDGANYGYSQISPQIGLDVSNSASGSSGGDYQVSLTTTSDNDLLYVSVVDYYSGTTISSSPSLSWTNRADLSFSSGSGRYLASFYAIAPSARTITITISPGGNAYSAAVAFAIKNVDTSSPFDGTIATNTGSSTTATVTKTTSNANDLIIGAIATNNVPTLTVGTGFTSIRASPQTAGSPSNRQTWDEYKVVSQAYPSGLSVGFGLGASNSWGIAAEAIRQVTNPLTFNWVTGSTHTVTAASTVSAGTGKQYSWGSWTNPNGLSGASGTLTVPTTAQIVTANYVTKYQVSFAMNPTGMGTINPSTPTWYTAGSNTIPLTATADPGHIFLSWGITGSITLSSSSSSSTTITAINSPGTITANFADSGTVTISPTTLSMDVGQSQTFLATPAGGSGGFTYKWYLNGGLVSGQTASTYAFTAIAAGSNSVYAIATDSQSNSATSNTVTFTVADLPTVNIAPADPFNMFVGDSRTFTASASGGSGTLSYQWYLNDLPVSGQTGTSYTFTASAAGLPLIYVKVTDQASSPLTVQSNTPTITVLGASISPSSWTMDVGQSNQFTAAAAGGSGSYTAYQWYVNGAIQTGEIAQTFSFSSGSAGSYSVTVTVTDSLGHTSPQSSPALVTVNALPTVTIAPVGPLLMDVGQGQVFTASPVGGSGIIHYQWYVNAVAVGTDNAHYSYAASGASASITCTVTDSASPPILSAPAAVSVTINSALISPSTSASLSMITQTQSSTLSFTGLSGGTAPYNYQWLAKAPGAGSYSAISGATSNTYIFTPSLSNAPGIWSFKLQVTDSASSGVRVTSSVSSVLVNSGSTVWDFEDHTYTHDDLTLQTQAQIITQETTQNSLFTQYGLPVPVILAYPSGYYDATVISVISQYRQAARLANSGDIPALYPITAPYELSSQELASDTTYQHIKDNIDAAIQQKGLLNLYSHQVTDNMNSLQVYPGCTPQLLQQVLDYLKLQQDAGNLQVLTARQALSSFDGQIAVVTISFDDGLMTDYTVAYPMFLAHGFAGTSYLPGHLIADESGSIYRLTWAQVDEMAKTNPPAWTLTVSSNPTVGGSTSLSGTISVQQYSPSITATPAAGYVFGGWVFDGNTLTTNTVTLDPQASGSTHSLTAYFVPNAASTVYQDGFESGSFDPNWYTSGSTTITSSPNPVHAGVHAAKAVGNSNWEANVGASYGNLFFSGYVQFPQLPSSDGSIFFMYIYPSPSGNSVRGGIYENSAGTSNHWLLNVGGTWFESSSPANLQTNHWYFIEIERNNAGVARMWVDNVLVCAAYGQTLTNSASHVQGGNPSSATPAGYISYGDDYQVATGYITGVLPPQDPVVFSSGFDSPNNLSDWSGFAGDNLPHDSATVISTDSHYGGYSLDSKLYTGSSRSDEYKNLPTSSALYLGMWTKSINFVSSNPAVGWSEAVGVGGFEPTTIPHSHTEIVAVNTGTGIYWGLIYSKEPLGTLGYVATNIPVVDGQWIHFVLYENVGTGQNDGAAILYVQTGATWTIAAQATGFNAVPDYAHTGVWVGQYIANGIVSQKDTEFHMDSILVSTSFSTFDIFTIDASATAGGSISPSGSIYIDRGGSQTFTVTTNPGYHLVSVLIDGSPATAPYTFSNVIANHTIAATFAIDTFSITVTSDHGNPTASGSANWGTDFPVSVTSPDVIVVNGHQFVCTGFSVDGGNLQAGTTYTFTNVQASHTISFSWKEQFYVTVDNAGHGAPSVGSGWVDKGSSFSTTVTTPIDVVPGVSQWVTSSPTLAIADVEAAQTLTFSWTEQWYLSVANGGHGSTLGQGWYNDQSSVTVSIVSPVFEGGHWYVCTGFTGSGSLSSGGSGNSATFTISSASSISWIWNLDTASPLTTATITSGTLGTNNWYTSSTIHVSLTASDPAPSSLVKEIHYKLDTGTEQIISGASTSLVISGEGPHTLKYWAVDNEGHIETQNTLNLKIDSIAPVVTINAPANGMFYKSAQVPDSSVGVTEGNVVESGYSVTQGAHTYSVTATDDAGNVGSASVSYTVDDTPAVAVISSPFNNGWFNTGSLAISGTGSDNVGGSGLQKVEYQVDSSSGSWLSTSTSNGYAAWSISLSGLSEGSHIVYVRATDNLGNVQTPLASVTFGVDTSPPVISGAATTLANGNGWYNHDVVVHFTASDGVSAVASLTSDTTLTVEGTGWHVVGTAVDLAGNSATFDVTGINIDKTAPVVTITNPVNGAYYKSSAVPPAAFSVIEVLSGISSSPVQSGYSTTQGAHTYSVTYTDDAGNVGSASVSYTVDDTPAVAVISSPLSTTWLKTGSVVVSGTGSDNIGGSGLQKVEYQVDSSSGSWLSTSTSNGYAAWSASVPVSGLSEGSHIVYVRATDNLGNVQTPLASVTFGVDTSPPVISGAATTLANGNGWYNHDVVVHFTASDGVSAVASLTSDTTLTVEGTGWHVVGTAVDLAGNSATFDVTGINIDKTPPTVTITNLINGAYYKGSNLPSGAYTQSDGLSGIQPPTTTGGYGASEGVHTYTVTVTDNAGNVRVASVTFTVDNTAPIVTISAPLNGAHYTQATVPAAAFSVTEINPWTAVEDGYSTIVGTHTYTVTVTDGAGNVGVESVTYIIDPAPVQYTITVTQSAHGSISPTTASYPAGNSQDEVVLPASGYHISSITVDGNSVTVATPSGQTVSFSNIQLDHTITATFDINNQPPSVNSVHLMLNTGLQVDYSKGQTVTFTITAMNQMDSRLESTLTLTITGPGGYSFYDFQPINVSANSVKDYSFNWVVPNLKGTYIVETSLAPAQLTAYDAKYIQTVDSQTGFADPLSGALAVTKSVVSQVSLISVLFVSQALSGVYIAALLVKIKGKHLWEFGFAPRFSIGSLGQLRIAIHG